MSVLILQLSSSSEFKTSKEKPFVPIAGIERKQKCRQDKFITKNLLARVTHAKL